MPDITKTGRDGYIIATALAYAITAIDSLQFHMREVSDRDDMEALLRSLVSDDRSVEHYLQNAERHLRKATRTR